MNVCRMGLGLVAMVLGCATPNTPESERPGPSEDHEESLVGSSSEQAPTDPLDPDLAAKQAAAQQVLDQVNDRDQEQEKKKLAASHVVSRRAADKLAKGQLKEAVKSAREALKVHEQNIDAMLVIAEVYYKEGKYELVRAVASSALQIDAKIRTPAETSRAYNLQGFAMLAMGESSQATQSFKKAAETDDQNAAAWNNLGTRYLEVGDVGMSISCFQYAIQLDPRFFKAQLNYGAALRANRQWEDAEVVLRKALELRPGYPEAFFNLGVLYLDADPFPGLDTKQRLNKAILNLSKYRELARTKGGAYVGSSTPGMGAAGAGKAPPPRVSKERADDFIRVAKKGIEREDRRIDREKERATAEPEPAAATPTDEGGAEAAGDSPTDATPTEAVETDPSGAELAEPEQPAPQGPGAPAKPAPSQPAPQGQGATTPDSPAPQGPSAPVPAKPAPSEPAPAKPSPSTPDKPAPAKPSPSTPDKPAPAKPSPSTPDKPAPAKPSPSAPDKPAPTKPAPSAPEKPAPTKPAPAKPAPSAPAPQKPSVQKPQSASLTSIHRIFDVAAPGSKKVFSNPVSRGTRCAPSTLSSMEGGTFRGVVSVRSTVVGYTPCSASAPIVSSRSPSPRPA